MKKIYFIASAPIQYSFDGKSIYKSFNVVSQGLRSAPLAKNARAIVNRHAFPSGIREIFTAPTGQTFATAEIIQRLKKIPAVTISQTPLLENIHFKMTQLISRAEFEKLGYEKAIIKARTAFVERLFEGKFSEKLPEVMQRIKNLVDKLERQERDVLCIGHSFFLKLTEIYLLHPHVFENMAQLQRYFEPEKRPYAPLHGFMIHSSLKNLSGAPRETRRA